MPDYTDSRNNLILQCDHVKDLGIYMSHNLCFNHYISESIKRCSQLVGWILRYFNTITNCGVSSFKYKVDTYLCTLPDLHATTNGDKQHRECKE